MRHALCTLAGLALSCGCATALAAGADDRYAILALIGDEMTIVTYQPAVGSSLDANTQQKVALGDDSFDRNADLAIDAAIHRAASDAKTTMVAVSDPALTTRSEELVDSPDRMKALVAPIAAQVGPDVRWLVVVTKHRDDARLHTATGEVGAGKLSGLGFYVDRYPRVTRRGVVADRARGFLAPYAYLSISLVDLASGAVVRTRSIAESTTVSNAHNPTSFDPWEAMSAQRKAEILQGMVRRAVDVNVPLLLAPT
jgi:hypothetical protein